MRTTERRGTSWKHYVFYRKDALKTTWLCRILLLMLVLLSVAATQRVWTAAFGNSLICPETLQPGDAILVENFDPNYLVFARAATLQQEGWAARVLVPLFASDEPGRPSAVAQGIAEVMIRIARLAAPEFIPIQYLEPISLNAASQIRAVLTREHIRSVIVVTPGFRSQRSHLVYQAVLAPAGITVSCVPVFGQETPVTWTHTWHGIQNVTEQWLKLQYYRFYVLWKRSV